VTYKAIRSHQLTRTIPVRGKSDQKRSTVKQLAMTYTVAPSTRYSTVYVCGVRIAVVWNRTSAFVRLRATESESLFSQFSSVEKPVPGRKLRSRLQEAAFYC
jgi:hypothetical protein